MQCLFYYSVACRQSQFWHIYSNHIYALLARSIIPKPAFQWKGDDGRVLLDEEVVVSLAKPAK